MSIILAILQIVYFDALGRLLIYT